MTKPPYALPSMADVARARGSSGLVVVSTFSGCGGSCLGFEQAGYRVAWASEFVPAAQETYRANHPRTILDERDIREVKGSEILAAIGRDVGDVDVLNGSPPCASFSTAGMRDKGWGRVKKYSDVAQRSDDLFYEFARLLREIRPRVFVAENVAGLVKGTSIGYFKGIMRELAAVGYRVRCRVVDAQWLGVPQVRERTIFVGVRDDLGIDPVHPRPLPYNYSIREVLPHLERVVYDTSGNAYAKPLDVTDTPSPTITVGTKSINSYHYKVSGATLADDPGAAEASVVRSVHTRRFTMRELKRICAFPEDFVLTGTYLQQWERLGRAVPPRMMFHVARAIRDEIFGRRDVVEAP